MGHISYIYACSLRDSRANNGGNRVSLCPGGRWGWLKRKGYHFKLALWLGVAGQTNAGMAVLPTAIILRTLPTNDEICDCGLWF